MLSAVRLRHFDVTWGERGTKRTRLEGEGKKNRPTGSARCRHLFVIGLETLADAGALVAIRARRAGRDSALFGEGLGRRGGAGLDGPPICLETPGARGDGATGRPAGARWARQARPAPPLLASPLTL